MNVEPGDFKKLFTVDEANAALPLVGAICEDLARLSRDVVERRERLGQLRAGHQDRPSASDAIDPYREELDQIAEELENDTSRVREYVEELRELGVEPKNGPAGLVDFPSLLDGRVVFLCWKLGESEVLYWHEMDAGFQGRQPLTAEAMTGSDFFDSGDFEDEGFNLGD